MVRAAYVRPGTAEFWRLEMISQRDSRTGDITVSTAVFSVLISEDGLKVKIGEEIVHAWSLDQHNADTPSPRSRPTKRGSR
jgi:hypothetical protein